MTDKPFMCGACHKRFTTIGGARDHAEKRHRSAGAMIFQAVQRVAGQGRDDEPSMADLAVEATIARLSGERSENDWLLP